MKVLSVKQPYAYLLAIGAKDVENRGTGTKYRGDLVIQVSKTWKPADVEEAIRELAAEGLIDEEINTAMLFAQRGHAIAVVELVDVVEGADSPWAIEGQKHWKVRDARRLDPQVKVGGAHTLIDCKPEHVEAITRALRGTTEPKKTAGATTVKGISQEVLERCDVKTAIFKPFGSLPMGAKHCIRIRDTDGSELYDSSGLPNEAGLFETPDGAGAHASAWYAAQRERLVEAGMLRTKRRLALPGRLDEVDEALAVVNAAAKKVTDAKKACANDHTKLRTEARDPKVEIVWSGDGFTTAAAASLSEQTDRAWYGSLDGEGERLVPPLGVG